MKKLTISISFLALIIIIIVFFRFCNLFEEESVSIKKNEVLFYSKPPYDQLLVENRNNFDIILEIDEGEIQYDYSIPKKKKIIINYPSPFNLKVLKQEKFFFSLNEDELFRDKNQR